MVGVSTAKLVLLHPEEREKAMTEMKQKQQVLQDERMALLAKNCLSPSLLKLEYACEKCRDTGYIEGTPCTCMRRRLMDRLYDQSNVRDVIKLENFDTFDLRLFDTEVVPAEGISPKENAQRNLKKAMEFAEHPEGENLLLYGGAGRGKTFLCNCIAKEVLEPMGKRLKGVRIDSGDLAYLSKKTRKMLDEAGLTDCQIVASNSLDEYTISSLIDQGGRIDSFGVGERLITSKSEPVFGAVYKISAVKRDGVYQPRIKVSENVEKITNPGLKKVYRIYDETGKAVADLIGKYDEEIDLTKPFRYVDPVAPWRQRTFDNCTGKELQVPIFKDGKLVYKQPSLEEIRAYVKEQMKEEMWPEEQRFENPHVHYLDMTPDYYDMKMELLYEVQK